MLTWIQRASDWGRNIPWSLKVANLLVFAVIGVVLLVQIGIPKIQGYLAKRNHEQQIERHEEEMERQFKAAMTPTPEFLRQFEIFQRDAARLNALVTQGCSGPEFSGQLATTVASWDITQTVWPPLYHGDARIAFAHALDAWSDAKGEWDSALRSARIYSGPPLLGTVKMHVSEGQGSYRKAMALMRD